MDSPKKRFAVLFATRRNRMIWLALVGFFVGSAICPFNPPARDETQSMRAEEAIRYSSNDNRNKERTMPASEAKSQEFETATFALG